MASVNFVYWYLDNNYVAEDGYLDNIASAEIDTVIENKTVTATITSKSGYSDSEQLNIYTHTFDEQIERIDAAYLAECSIYIYAISGEREGGVAVR